MLDVAASIERKVDTGVTPGRRREDYAARAAMQVPVVGRSDQRCS
jgi:hypothetical protein